MSMAPTNPNSQSSCQNGPGAPHKLSQTISIARRLPFLKHLTRQQRSSRARASHGCKTMRQARAALLLGCVGSTAGFHAPPARRRAPTTCAASILGELGTHLLAFDFSSTHVLAFDFDSLKDSVLDARDSVLDAKDSVLDARDSVLDAKDSVLDAKEAAADSVAQAKASALEQVETTKANAVGAVLKPIKEAKAALPPEVQSVIPEKVDLPTVSLPGSVPDLGELAEPAGPFAGVKATFQTAGIGAVLGGLVGAKVGWEARGAAVAASNAKDAVAAQLEKVQKAVK